MRPISLAPLLLAAVASAELRLSPLCSDHAVLQRDARARVWGTADPGAAVRVRTSWDGAERGAVADADGRFAVEVETPGAGGPHRIEVASGDATRAIEDVYSGDVWIASGQSNMEWKLADSAGGDAFAAQADLPKLRFFQVAHRTAAEPQHDVEGAWVACTPATAPAQSAVAFHFARRLVSEVGVPIGIVQATWGGTVAEAWISPDGLRAFSELGPAPAQDGERSPNRASALYHGMIAPLLPLSIRGAIWYQGESNVGRAYQYRRLFPALIADWRERFAQGDFPFYYVQIAPFAYPEDRGELAELREAQALAQSVANAGMAVTIDVGDPKDIHPANKDAVGDRLARLALKRTYGKSDVADTGPTFRALTIAGREARVAFDHAEGLTSRGAPLRCFEIAGADRTFHPAQARIEGETVVLASELVPEPVAVRFAWGATDVPNLWNAAGLPAPSFRTDDAPR